MNGFNEMFYKNKNMFYNKCNEKCDSSVVLTM